MRKKRACVYVYAYVCVDVTMIVLKMDRSGNEKRYNSVAKRGKIRGGDGGRKRGRGWGEERRKKKKKIFAWTKRLCFPFSENSTTKRTPKKYIYICIYIYFYIYIYVYVYIYMNVYKYRYRYTRSPKAFLSPVFVLFFFLFLFSS